MTGPYYNESLARDSVQTTAQAEDYAGMADFLASDWLHQEITNGNVTVAMIRPNLQGSTLEDWTDETAADIIESSISLGMITKFSVEFDEEAVEAFYTGTPKNVQQGMAPERPGEHADRWDEFVHLMGSGATTVMLLYSPENDSIGRWRQQVGHYDIVGRRDPATIRGRFGRDNYNNLVHGSDSAASVETELEILQALLRRQAQSDEGRNRANEPDAAFSSAYKARLLGNDTLELLGISNPDSIQIVRDWFRSGETYVTEFLLDTGQTQEHLVAKACIKYFPRETVAEWLQRRSTLEAGGVSTPSIFKVDGATIIEEFIPFSFREAFKAGSDIEKAQLQDSFITMYTQVIQAGFRPLGFHDLRSRGNDAVMIDFGEDLGGITETEPMTAETVAANAKQEFLRYVS